jgi:hypothetical protein
MKDKGVNWSRVGAVALIGFATSALAAFSVGAAAQAWTVALGVACLQGLLCLGTELKAETDDSGQVALPFLTVF